MSTIVVTGGGKGIGLGVATAARATGADVAVFDSDPGTREAAEEIGATFWDVDVTDPSSLSAAFQGVAEAGGPIRGLVNGAGLTRTAPSTELSAEDWRLVLEVDLTGTFFSCQAAFPHMEPGGSIVNLASVMSVRAHPRRAAYTAAKYGVVGVTRVLAVEWAHRARVNAVGPSWTDTPMLRGLIAEGKLERDDLVSRVPMQRLGTVDDIVKPIMFLLGDESEFVTGQVLYIDGGYTWAGTEPPAG